MEQLLAIVERNLPVLVVVVPLIGGVLSVFMGRGQRPWLWACAVTSVVLALCCLLLVRVMDAPDHVVSCALGSWPPPWGIEYRVDPLNAFVLAVVATIAVVVTLYSRLSVMKEIGLDRQRFFYSLWLLAISGLLGITVTGDAFNVYVLLEISSLTIYGLIGMGKELDRRALTATFNYLILGSIGASFILIGIGYLYMVTGTLNMEDMGDQLRALQVADPGNRTVLTAFSFLMVGLAMKMALFPVHVWLPNAYTYAPTAVTALLAATATKVGVYMSFRFLYTIFGLDYSFDRVPNNQILMVCASLAIVYGSFSAIRQTNLKRLLAYSSVGQIGYIVLGFSLANMNGVTGSLVHIFYHALIKGGMFLALGAVIYRLGSPMLEDMRGIGRRMPITMGAFTLGGFGLVGVPLTGGFVGKWYLVNGALDKELWPVAIVVLVGSLLALAYMWRIVEVAYLQPPPEDCEEVEEAPLSLVVPAVALIGVSTLYGVTGVGIVEIARNAAAALNVPL
ncbi:MAG: monovalent cation/H+ antiporter subunit D family protein [Planctomycetota bacterium]